MSSKGNALSLQSALRYNEISLRIKIKSRKISASSMSTPQMRWLVAWSICALAMAKLGHAQKTGESEDILKKRIMEEEILLKFLNQLNKISQRLQVGGARLAIQPPGGTAKRIGSEFLGKRNSPNAPSPGLDIDDVTTAAILANQLLNFDTTSKKRLGSEFLGKRSLGSEFLGKKSTASGQDRNNVERWTQQLTIDEDVQ